MALQLKANTTYPDPYDGDLTNAYANIKYCGGWHAYNKEITFDVFTYRTEADRQASKRPLSNDRFSITGDDYDTYIGDAVVTAGLTLEEALAKQAYSYLLNATMDDPATQPGQEPAQVPLQFGSINMNDWESDE